MSQALSVFLIPHKQDLQIFGCRNRRLLKEVLEAAAEVFEDLDEEFDFEVEENISHVDALKEIFAGKLTREKECGYIYGHAYEVYCEAIGDYLSNKYFSPTTVSRFEQLDEFFQKKGVPLRFHKLLFEDFPIPVDTDATPCGGFWEHDEIVAAQEPLAAVLNNDTSEEILIKASFTVLEWCSSAIKTPGSVIVGFFD